MCRNFREEKYGLIVLGIRCDIMYATERKTVFGIVYYHLILPYIRTYVPKECANIAVEFSVDRENVKLTNKKIFEEKESGVSAGNRDKLY